VEDPVAMLNKLQKQKLNDQHAIDDVSIGKLPLGTNVPRPDESEHRNDTYGTKQSDE
jgi:hypothetical protein